VAALEIAPPPPAEMPPPEVADNPFVVADATQTPPVPPVEEVSAPPASEISTVSQTELQPPPGEALNGEMLAAIHAARPLEKSDLIAQLSSPELIGLLKDADPDNRSLAAYSLGYSSDSSPNSLDALRLALATEAVDFVRIRLAEAIVRLVPTDPAVTLLVGYLSDSDSELRWLAASVLTVASHDSPGVIDGLTAAVQDHDPKVAAMAALALANYGQAAAAAIPALRDACRSGSSELREAAAAALACIQPRAVASAAAAPRP
jgi:HEAT repeat protein